MCPRPADRSELLALRGKANALKKGRRRDDPELVAAERARIFKSLGIRIDEVNDGEPKLTDEQRTELATRLLHPAGTT